MSAEEYYDHTTYPVANSPATSQALRNEFELVEAGFAKMPDLSAGAGKPVIVAADGSRMQAVDTFPDNTAGNVSTTAHGFAPKLPGSALLFLRGDGTYAAPGTGSAITLIERTSNTQFVAGNTGTIIDITSGTFTQTFDPIASLGVGWFIYLRNSGTGDITLDPNGAELIDGLTSYIMYPGEVRLIQCNGTKLTSFVLAPFKKEFSTSGNFIKPPGYGAFMVDIWGGGGGGGGAAISTASGKGGGGGGYFGRLIVASLLSASTTVTIGAGGAGAASVAGSVPADGTPGGTSTFGSSLVSATGGQTSGANPGGGGGGNSGAAPYVGGTGAPSGTTSGQSPGGNSGLGGGAGGSGAVTTTATPVAGGNGGIQLGGVTAVGNTTGNGPAGAAFCGGAGGAATSTTGFNGGDGGIAAGGGGGGVRSGTSAGNGGRGGDGYCIVRGV